MRSPFFFEIVQSQSESELSVVGRDSSWVVDTKIPQNRVSSLQQAQDDDSLNVSVTLQTNREVSWAAKLTQIGPATNSSPNDKPASAVLMSVDDSGAWSTSSELSHGPLNGSPVQVVCRCGRVPLAYALLQDAIVGLRTSYRMYLGSPSLQPNTLTTSDSPQHLVTFDAN